MESNAVGPRARPDIPVLRIKADSPFSPSPFSFCQYDGKKNPLVHDPQYCIRSHDGKECRSWDNMGRPVLAMNVPAVFTCSCNEEHTAFEVMTQDTIACSCGSPRLQAVYDQFGTILLWPQGDHGMDDLRDPKKVAEARRQFLAVGGAVWLENREKVLDYFKTEGSPKFLHAVEVPKRVVNGQKEVQRELSVESEDSRSPSLSPSFSASPSPSPSDDVKGLEPTEMLLGGAEVGLLTYSAKEVRAIHLVKHTRGWSEASVETEDSFDAELASWGVMNYPG